MGSARLLALLAAALVALAVAPGCGRPDETRFDAVPGPLRTVDVATAAALEAIPLSEDEWASVEAMHDRYLQEFDTIRRETTAPLAREVWEARAAAARANASIVADGTLLARLGKRSAAALSRIKSLDDRFAAELSESFPGREAFIDRLARRRAIARAAAIVEGGPLAASRSDATILDLEDTLRTIPLDRATRLALEPALADYRRDMARACERLASAFLELPARRLALREAAGLSDARLAELLAAARGSGPEAKEAKKVHEQASRDQAALEPRVESDRLRAFEEIDAANRRGLEALVALLPPEAAESLRDADLHRRDDEYASQSLRFLVDVAAAHPATRAGRAPETARAIARCREISDEISRISVEWVRSSFGAGAQDGGQALAKLGERAGKLREQRTEAWGRLTKAFAEECQEGNLAEFVGGNPGMRTVSETLERLAPVVGRVAAERIIGRTPRNMFRDDRSPRDTDYSSDLSFAEQLLLAPAMDHAAFRRAARALGANDDDPLVEQLWERHSARVAGIEGLQRERLRSIERESMDLARSSTPPATLERTIAGYLRALIEAEGERQAADEATFQEIAIAIAIPGDDPRMALARAVSSARQASLPWRRFMQPWLLGALWESDSDPLSMVLGVDDEVRRDAALVAIAPQADRLRAAADDARRAGLESLRDLLLVGIRVNDGMRGNRDPESLRDEPEIRTALARIRAAAIGRREAQRAAIEAVGVVDQALATEMLHRWVRDTLPEFFVDGPAWRAAEDLAEAGPPPDRGDGQAPLMRAAIDRWTIVADDLARRAAEWQDGRRDAPPASSAAELVRNAAIDPALGTLRTLRDESSWRLLRIAATSAGGPPDARMDGEDGAGGSLRPAVWRPR